MDSGRDGGLKGEGVWQSRGACCGRGRAGTARREEFNFEQLFLAAGVRGWRRAQSEIGIEIEIEIEVDKARTPFFGWRPICASARLKVSPNPCRRRLPLPECLGLRGSDCLAGTGRSTGRQVVAATPTPAGKRGTEQKDPASPGTLAKPLALHQHAPILGHASAVKRRPLMQGLCI